jgi:hypothetical protein
VQNYRGVPGSPRGGNGNNNGGYDRARLCLSLLLIALVCFAGERHWEVRRLGRKLATAKQTTRKMSGKLQTLLMSEITAREETEAQIRSHRSEADETLQQERSDRLAAEVRLEATTRELIRMGERNVVNDAGSDGEVGKQQVSELTSQLSDAHGRLDACSRDAAAAEGELTACKDKLKAARLIIKTHHFASDSANSSDGEGDGDGDSDGDGDGGASDGGSTDGNNDGDKVQRRSSSRVRNKAMNHMPHLPAQIERITFPRDAGYDIKKAQSIELAARERRAHRNMMRGGGDAKASAKDGDDDGRADRR